MSRLCQGSVCDSVVAGVGNGTPCVESSIGQMALLGSGARIAHRRGRLAMQAVGLEGQPTNAALVTDAITLDMLFWI
jgi:hypothetical protein